MVIHSVATFPLYVPLQEPYGDANGYKTYRSSFLFRIRTASGLTGWGECVDTLSALEREFQERIIPFLIGRKSTDRTQLVKAIKRWHPRAAAGVSMALTEILAVKAGVTVCDLWGGAMRSCVPVYASFQSYSDKPDWMRHSITLVEKAVSEGFTQLKVKVGGRPFAEDEAHLLQVMDVCGDAARLALDANASYDRPTALRWKRTLSQSDQWLWFEEPMPMWRIAEYAVLRSQIEIPLAGGEDIPGVREFLPVVQEGMVDILNPDVMHVGGIDAFREALQLARHCGFRTSPHAYDGPLTRLYSVLAQACLPAWSKMRKEDIEPVEWDVMPNPLTDLLPVQPINGLVSVPTGIGIGMQLDMDLLKAYRWDGMQEA